MSERTPAALFLVDKPTGPTSHDIVQLLRRWTGVRRVGHGGTLDPMASGLLPVFVGNATRLIEYIGEHRKSYTATLRLGVSTDTDDAEGAVTAEAPVPQLTEEAVDVAMNAFRGEVEQVPPDYSAVKVGGVSAHRAARQGSPITMAPRRVTVHELTLEGWASPLLQIAMTVSTGTYVRAIARDLGTALGCGAHVVEMRRTQIGPIRVADAHTPDALEAAFDKGTGWELAISPARFLDHWPQITINDSQRQLIFNGQSIEATSPVRGATQMLALDRAGRPMAVLVPDGAWPERWRPVKVLGKRQ